MNNISTTNKTKAMKKGLIQGSIAGGLSLVIGLIVMHMYPPFTIEDVLFTATGTAIGNFIAVVIRERNQIEQNGD